MAIDIHTGGISGKESTCQCRIYKRCGFNPWNGKMTGKMKWHPTPVFLPGKYHGQRSLVGYSPRDSRESDTLKRLRIPDIGADTGTILIIFQINATKQWSVNNYRYTNINSDKTFRTFSSNLTEKFCFLNLNIRDVGLYVYIYLIFL